MIETKCAKTRAAAHRQRRPKTHDGWTLSPDDASLIDAAKLLQAGTDLVIVCDVAGLLAGVITKTDVVAQISRCQGASCMSAVAW